MSVERHLLKATLVQVPILGITLVHVVYFTVLYFSKYGASIVSHAI